MDSETSDPGDIRKTADYFRLFMVPGMGHCGGGIGAGIQVRDVVTALEQWAEKGVAPETFVGVGKAPLEPAKPMTHQIGRAHV